MNETQPSKFSSPSSFTAQNLGKTFGYYCLLFVVALNGNIFIGIIVDKTKTMRRTMNYFIVNMAMSDLLFQFLCFRYFCQRLTPVASVKKDRPSAWCIFTTVFLLLDLVASWVLLKTWKLWKTWKRWKLSNMHVT